MKGVYEAILAILDDPAIPDAEKLIAIRGLMNAGIEIEEIFEEDE